MDDTIMTPTRFRLMRITIMTTLAAGVGALVGWLLESEWYRVVAYLSWGLLAGVLYDLYQTRQEEMARKLEFFTHLPKSPLQLHAENEIALANAPTHLKEKLTEMIRIFSDLEHKGINSEYVMDLLDDLTEFKNLAPLTDNPAEWELVSEYPHRWQNYRNPQAFSTDGGRTYYIVADPNNTIHISKESHSD